MITTLFLNLLFGVINFFLGFLPAVSLSGWTSSVSVAIHTLFGYMSTFSFILPIATLIQVLALVLAFEVGLLLYRFVMWVIKLIRPHSHALIATDKGHH